MLIFKSEQVYAKIKKWGQNYMKLKKAKLHTTLDKNESTSILEIKEKVVG